MPLQRLTGLIIALFAAFLLASCGDEGSGVIQKKVGEGTRAVGFPVLATKNTTRVPGRDPVEDAAAVSRAVYPALGDVDRPQAVALVDKSDWRAAIAAAVLMGPPLGAPVLLSDGRDIPTATADALESLRPGGSPYAAGAQVVLIGAAPKPQGFRSVRVSGRDPFSLANEIDSFAARARGRVSERVMVAPVNDAAYAMPAAGWAAKSGDPVLFAQRNSLPSQTRQAIARHRRPAIYVVGPPSVISDGVVKELRRLGRVTRVGGPDPITNAIAFARFSDGSFGWGAQDPGHGLVIANTDRPADAAAAAPLSARGTYGPLLLSDSSTVLPPELTSYLLDIQPGYQDDPVRGVYNHAWLIGDESAISAIVQAKIDELTEIQRVGKRPAP